MEWVNCLALAEDRSRWTINLEVSYNLGNSMTGVGIINLSRKTLLREVICLASFLFLVFLYVSLSFCQLVS
jgi:hypothetical protein